MPESVFAFLVLKLVKSDSSILVDRTVEFNGFAIAGEMLSAICNPVTPCSYSRTEPSGKVILTITN